MLLDDIKTFLGITDTSEDVNLWAFLQEILTELSWYIWPFLEESHINTFNLHNGKCYLHGTKVIITKVEYSSCVWFAKNWQELDTDHYSFENTILETPYCYWKLKVSYSTGYSEDGIPDDIKNIILMYVKDKRDKQSQITQIWSGQLLKKEVVDGDSFEFQTLSTSTLETTNPAIKTAMLSLKSKYQCYAVYT